jgi:hypothetical protein
MLRPNLKVCRHFHRGQPFDPAAGQLNPISPFCRPYEIELRLIVLDAFIKYAQVTPFFWLIVRPKSAAGSVDVSPGAKGRTRFRFSNMLMQSATP